MKFLHVLVATAVGLFEASCCPGGSQEATRFPESSSSGPKRLIKTSAELPGQWLDEYQIGQLIQKHANFVDITDFTHFKESNPEVNTKNIPKNVEFSATVGRMLDFIDESRMKSFIESFSSYHTRYYTSDTGLQSQKWLLAQAQNAVEGYNGTVEVLEFTHSFPQNSIIVRITGSDSEMKNQKVIIGAHQDSVNSAGVSLNAPGADDNASGSAIVLEVLRVCVESNFVPMRTVEFHWYAAEEIGLRGSGDISEEYKLTEENVIGMVNFDVCGYYSNDITDIGIYTDYTNSELNDFLRTLVDYYCDWGWRNRTCGYGCSDHASWTSRGFPAAMPSEVVHHPQMHTPRDNLESLSIPQIKQFAMLGVAFIGEMGKPINSKD